MSPPTLVAQEHVLPSTLSISPIFTRSGTYSTSLTMTSMTRPLSPLSALCARPLRFRYVLFYHHASPLTIRSSQTKSTMPRTPSPQNHTCSLFGQQTYGLATWSWWSLSLSGLRRRAHRLWLHSRPRASPCLRLAPVISLRSNL